MPRVYEEGFEDGAGGWTADLRSPLPVWDSVAYCCGPWSVDANHAPPGAGYLHLLMYLLTHPRSISPETTAQHGVNRFVEGGCSRDLRDAKLSVRLRGIMDLAGPLCNNHVPVPRPDLDGAQLLLLAQAQVERPQRTTANFVLTGQPFRITPEWSEQTVCLVPDPAQWTCLGARHDLTDTYGYSHIGDVLRDVNVDIIFVLFPLRVVPLGKVDDRDRQWAAKDYKVDMQYLPKGLVMFDSVRIQYPE
jgi:hypothetical protein